MKIFLICFYTKEQICNLIGMNSHGVPLAKMVLLTAS